MAKSKGVGEHQEKSNPGCVLGPVAVGSPLFRPSGGISRVRDIEALDVAHIKYSVHNIPASTLSSIKRLFRTYNADPMCACLLRETSPNR